MSLTNGKLADVAPTGTLRCPLLAEGDCLIHADRPPRCRSWGLVGDDGAGTELTQAIAALSIRAFRTLTGQEAPQAELFFSSVDVISGKFVQLYFQAMTATQR